MRSPTPVRTSPEISPISPHGHQHRTDAEHRQKVNKCNYKRKYQRILYSDHGKSEVKLCKDEKHHDEVCLEIFPERIRYASFHKISLPHILSGMISLSDLRKSPRSSVK